MPTSRKKLVIVGIDDHDLLHIFGSSTPVAKASWRTRMRPNYPMHKLGRSLTLKQANSRACWPPRADRWREGPGHQEGDINRRSRTSQGPTANSYAKPNPVNSPRSRGPLDRAWSGTRGQPRVAACLQERATDRRHETHSSLYIDGSNQPWQPILSGDSLDHEPFLTARQRPLLTTRRLGRRGRAGFTRTRTAKRGCQVVNAPQ